MNPAYRPLLVVYTALMVLLALTVGSAFLSLGGLNPILNIAISAAKTALIYWFFMELRAASTLIRLAAFSGFYWIAILFAFAVWGLLTR